ncbi:MAG: HlyD family secretion protein [Methylobacteriaceae bacterium]|nr:HlyD family secretion protein [Methylobacteriaceae bacterium]
MTEQIPKERFERLADPVAATVAPAEPVRETTPAAPGGARRKVVAILASAALLAGLWYGYRYVTEGRFIVATDDAYVKADVATISAKVGGNLVGVPVVDNQKVKAGDILVQIDPGDYKLAMAAAARRIDTQTATIARIDAQRVGQEAAVGQARAQLTAAQADQARAASEFERVVQLVEKKFATPQRLDLARADRDRTTAAVAGATAAVAAAEAALAVIAAQETEADRMRDELRVAHDKTKRDLDFTTVRAPFDGVVGNRAAQLGALVAPGTRLMSLIPLDTVYVEANFKETQLGGLKPGQKALLVVDAYAKHNIEGVVESVAPASGAQYSMLPPENATGNFTKIVQRVPVRIRVPAEVAKSGRLRPGMSVVVDVDTRTSQH